MVVRCVLGTAARRSGAPVSDPDPGTHRPSLLHDDGSRHRRAVHGAVVLIRALRSEPDRICPTAGLETATRERRRPHRLDAVRQRAGPGPGDGAAHRDRVHRRVFAPVLAAHELDAWARGDPPNGAAATLSPARTAPVGATGAVAPATPPPTP